MLRVPNAAVYWVIGGVVVMLSVVLCVPFAQRLFHFAPLHVNDLVISLTAGFTCVLWFEVLKQYRKWRHSTGSLA
jgi:Ca2+-transporting ATPase